MEVVEKSMIKYKKLELIKIITIKVTISTDTIANMTHVLLFNYSRINNDYSKVIIS